MKKILIGGGIVTFVFLCYYLFQPVFVWATGWQALPEAYLGVSKTGITDAEYSREIAEGQNMLSKYHERLQTPAISIAVGIGNKIIWTEARGYSDVKNKAIADVTTSFRIGSVSKAATSVGLGRLLEQGKIALNDTVGQYVPYFEHPEITIRQLASHTSGIRNYGLCFCFPIWEYYHLKNHNSIEKSVAVFNGDPLRFKPGTSFGYSTYNYTLLSAAMEEASGSKFLRFMTDEVFAPIGMTHTGADYADSVMTDRATFYEISDGEYKEAFPVDNSNKWAGGGLISTPSDLVKMGNALLQNSVLEKETVDTLFKAQQLADGTMNPQYYALGLRHQTFELFEGKNSVQVVHHGGTALGATALLILIPEYQLSIAMVMNRGTESFQLFDYVLPIAELFIARLQE